MNYVPFYQTWTLISHDEGVRDERAPPEPPSGNSKDNFRDFMQRRRVECRIPITTLAAEVKCDPAVLSAFERGDEVLPPAVIALIQKRLRE